MKSTEMIKLRLQVMQLLYANGNFKSDQILYDKARAMTNFIVSGSRIKKPVVDK